jgi:hypothetical protein
VLIWGIAADMERNATCQGLSERRSASLPGSVVFAPRGYLKVVPPSDDADETPSEKRAYDARPPRLRV